MKKLLYAVIATFALVSCSVDTTKNLSNSENLTYQVPVENTNVGTYIGVFTTNNSAYRATVEITIPFVANTPESKKSFATAKLTFNTGEVKFATASTIVLEGEQIENLAFSTQNLSFNFTVNNNGTEPTVSNVVYNSLQSSVLIAKDSERAPVSPILGSFTCTDCGTHPTMNSGITQTFNILSVADNGDGTADLSTQIMLNETAFTGDGLQGDCLADGTLTTCDAFGEFVVSNNPNVTWEGTHTYNNEPTGSNDCSDFNGTWAWASANWGELTGTFQSDDNCTTEPTVLAVEDFDGTTPVWVSTPDIAYFNAVNGTDYWGPSDGTTGGESDNIDYNVSGNFLYVQDLENSNGGTADFATLNFATVDVTGKTNVTISFDYDVVGFDGGDDVEYVVTIDGVAQSTVALITGVNGGGTSAENTEVINIPDGSTSVGFLIRIRQNGGSDYAGFDNFEVKGI